MLKQRIYRICRYVERDQKRINAGLPVDNRVRAELFNL